jgi:hypothetical protein
VQSGTTVRTTLAAMPYVPAGTGAVTTSVQAKLRETMSVFDFMPSDQIAYIQAGNTASQNGAVVTAAIQAAIDACASSGSSLHVPAGRYLCSTTLYTKQVAIRGDGYRIDVEGGSTSPHVYTQIESTANPIMKVVPYPGTLIEDLCIVGLGTTQTIELWEVASYTSQVGIFAGGATILTTPTDTYAVGGSGALYMNRVSFGGNLGWGLYCYKLWGMSSLKDLFFYKVGKVVGTDYDNYGAIAMMSECADTNIDNVHILSDGTVGTAIKIGAPKAVTDALNRFYIGPSHIRFKNVFNDGYTAKYGLRIYTTNDMKFTNCHFGEHGLTSGSTTISIGEVPVISSVNDKVNFLDCGFSYPKTIDIKSYGSVEFSGCTAENTTVFDYWAPFLFNGNSTNFSFYPTGDKAGIDWSEEAYLNLPVVNAANIDKFDYNYSPAFDSGATTWVKSTTGGASLSYQSADCYNVSVASSGTAELHTDITGLVAGELYTICLQIYVSSGYGSTIEYYAADGASPYTDIIRNKLGNPSTVITAKYCSRIIQVPCPSSGKIRLGFTVPSISTLNTMILFRPRMYKGPKAWSTETYSVGGTGARTYAELKIYNNES